MKTAPAFQYLIEQLTPIYGAGEANAISRIVFEDAFDRGRAFEENRFNAILRQLISGEPVQYVLGTADFFGLKFKVNPSVLIPRQETEELVAWILEELKADPSSNPPLLLDIGLGSGCIAITLNKKQKDLQLFGLEKSPEALATAIENAGTILGNDAQPQFLQGDILNRNDWAKFPLLDLVVSNPPYVLNSEMTLMPAHVLAHEPAMALFVDNSDALCFYRAIADFSLEKLRPGGKLFFECNEFNASEVANLLCKKGFSSVELRKDLSGADRMVKAVLG